MEDPKSVHSSWNAYFKQAQTGAAPAAAINIKMRLLNLLNEILLLKSQVLYVQMGNSDGDMHWIRKLGGKFQIQINEIKLLGNTSEASI